MPLWQVQLHEWTGGTIKQVVPQEVLVEFDQPLIHIQGRKRNALR